MNFFKLYIGDYQRDTGSLSLAEHGAYLMMLQHFYATEKPLQKGRELYRLLRCETKAERQAVDAVVSKFWEETDDGLVCRRAASELAKAEHQRTVNREIGKRGGRPKQTEHVTDSVSEHVTDSVSEKNPNQTPDTRQEQRATTATAVVVASEPATAKPATPDCPHAEIVALYHECLPSLRRVREWKGDRQAFLRSRWRERPERQSLAWWRGFFEYVSGCPLLMGEVPGRDGGVPFSADLEWLVRPTNFRKVIEGKYQRRVA